jgi:hypothetical protein
MQAGLGKYDCWLLKKTVPMVTRTCPSVWDKGEHEALDGENPVGILCLKKTIS